MSSHSVEPDAMRDAPPSIAAVELCWIPLGSGQHVVRASGRTFELISALAQRRPRCDLYHSALTVSVDDVRFAIEMAPVVDARGDSRGVVTGGPVGLRSLGRFRLFRYEIRRWRNGSLPDADATQSSVIVSTDPLTARRLLDLVPHVPTPTWGRDELDAGEMWNSNSVTSWLLATAGIEAERIAMPAGGRAPGWDAGLVIAARMVTPKSTHAARHQIAARERALRFTS